MALVGPLLGESHPLNFSNAIYGLLLYCFLIVLGTKVVIHKSLWFNHNIEEGYAALLHPTLISTCPVHVHPLPHTHTHTHSNNSRN